LRFRLIMLDAGEVRSLPERKPEAPHLYRSYRLPLPGRRGGRTQASLDEVMKERFGRRGSDGASP